MVDNNPMIDRPEDGSGQPGPDSGHDAAEQSGDGQPGAGQIGTVQFDAGQTRPMPQAGRTDTMPVSGQAQAPEGSPVQPTQMMPAVRDVQTAQFPAVAPAAVPSAEIPPAAVPPSAAASSQPGGQKGFDSIIGPTQRAEKRLLTHPRVSAKVWSVILGLLFLALAAGTWLAGVCTYRGQKFDDWVWHRFPETYIHASLLNRIFANSHLVVYVCAGIIALAVLIALIRKRWFLLVQIAVFGGLVYALSRGLKIILPRPVIDASISNPANSAPSGHTALAAAAAVIFVISVPRVLRALSSLFATVFVLLVGFSVIADKWHRPTDVIMAIFLVTGLALLTLAFTRGTGMDMPGRRTASASVQICATVMVTAGAMMLAYAAYMVWQLWDYILFQPVGFTAQINITAIFAICGCALISFGALSALRQATASPLSRAGMVGAPPAPPASPWYR